ncbi:MAG: hypothetical protein AAGK02_01115 [Pseudomonadota bacterium]
MLNALVIAVLIVFYIYAGLSSPLYSYPFLGLIVLFSFNWGWTVRLRVFAGFLFLTATIGIQIFMLEDVLSDVDDIKAALEGTSLARVINDFLNVLSEVELGATFWEYALINFLSLAGYVILIGWLVGAILWLIKKSIALATKASDTDEIEDSAEKVALWLEDWLLFQRHGAQRWIFIVSGVICVLLIGLLPFWTSIYDSTAEYLLVQFNLKLSQLSQTSNLGDQASFLWAGPLVFLLELVRNALAREIEEEGWFFGLRFTRKRRATHPIHPAYKMFQSRYRDHVLPFEIEPIENNDSDRPKKKSRKAKRNEPLENEHDIRMRDVEVLRQNVKRFGKPGKDYRAVWVKETLTSAHFDVMTELLQSHAFDAGGAAWIICPDHSVEECERHFHRASTETGTRFLQNWQSLRQVRSENRPIDVLIGSIEDFEREISSARVTDNLHRLTAVFILQLEQIDTGLLKIMGARMRALFEAFDRTRDNLLLWVQSENQKRTDDRVEQLFFTVGNQNVREMEPVQTDARGHRFYLIWNHADALDKALDRHVVNADRLQRAMPKIMLQTWMQDGEYGCYVADPEGRFHHRYWRGTLVGQVRNNRIGDTTTRLKLPQKFETLQSAQVVPPMVEAPIAFVEDHGNLATALSLGVRGYQVPEVMTHVMQANYPFATVIRDHIQKKYIEAKGAERLDTFRIVDGLDTLFGRVAPKPSGGIVELALIIAAELLSESAQGGKMVPQRRIEAFFRIIDVRPHIVRPLGISPTRRGLIRLFELAQGVRPDLKVQRQKSYEPAYSLNSTDINPRLRYFRVRTNAQGGGADVRATHPVADFGLSYDQDTLLRRDGSQYRVSRVDPGSGTVIEETNNTATAVEASFVYRRGYALGSLRQEMLLDDNADTLVDEAFRSNFAVDVSRLRQKAGNICEFNLLTLVAERRTFETIAFPRFRIDNPLQNANPNPAVGKSPRFLRNALHMRLFLDGHEAGDLETVRRLALTTATTLQDTLSLLFPRHAHRLAVLSPQAIGLRTELEQANPGEALEQAASFALFRQPFLSMSQGLAHAEQILPDTYANLGAMRQVYLRLCRMISAQGHDVRNDGLQRTPDQAAVDLIILEDSDHDLGVARATYECFEADVASPWMMMLEHMRSAEPRRAYYAFGTDKFPEVYAFEATSGAVRSIWSSKYK